MVYLSGANLPRFAGKKAIKRNVVVVVVPSIYFPKCIYSLLVHELLTYVVCVCIQDYLQNIQTHGQSANWRHLDDFTVHCIVL